MILQIDVTVTGPDSVLTGSVAVTVNPPVTAEASLSAAQPPAAGVNVQAQQFSNSMRWGAR